MDMSPRQITTPKCDNTLIGTRLIRERRWACEVLPDGGRVERGVQGCPGSWESGEGVRGCPGQWESGEGRARLSRMVGEWRGACEVSSHMANLFQGTDYSTTSSGSTSGGITPDPSLKLHVCRSKGVKGGLGLMSLSRTGVNPLN